MVRSPILDLVAKLMDDAVRAAAQEASKAWPWKSAHEPPRQDKARGSGERAGAMLFRGHLVARAEAPSWLSLSQHNTEVYDNKPVSITQENDLDSFLNTATLAGTSFTAERRNVSIIPTSTSTQQNPYLLTPAEQSKVTAKHKAHAGWLRVPRRPPWTSKTTAAELERGERDSFLEWRRGMAELTDTKDLLLTPFERNLEVWRQLWRVVERSHLVVQIVDARNPLRFRCEDLESYVRELRPEGYSLNVGDQDLGEGSSSADEGSRRNLLLINKADLLTRRQRRLWADYFQSQGIVFAFFSAANAAALQEAALNAEDYPLDEGESEDDGSDGARSIAAPPHYPPAAEQLASQPDSPRLAAVADSAEKMTLEHSTGEAPGSDREDDSEDGDPSDPTRVLTVLELEQLFLDCAPPLENLHRPDTINGDAGSSSVQPKLTVGLVGYPNVGKSSTINALVGAKKVSVSATPGKTKHFQTIHLSPEVILCDCPGLVFPQFASTKAELVCDGVLPIDQMREHTAPVTLVAQRIPKEHLEAVYGLRVPTLPVEEGGTGVPTASEILSAYAIARGYFTSGMGQPDEARAARPILKDYVNAKLLFCHPPPLAGLSADDFNQETRERSIAEGAGRKLAPTTRVGVRSDTYIPPPVAGPGGNSAPPLDAAAETGRGASSARSRALDSDFFTDSALLASRPRINGRAGEAANEAGFSRVQMFPHQSRIANDGTAIAGGGVPTQPANAGKKHFKARRSKQRSGRGYDV